MRITRYQGTAGVIAAAAITAIGAAFLAVAAAGPTHPDDRPGTTPVTAVTLSPTTKALDGVVDAEGTDAREDAVAEVGTEPGAGTTVMAAQPGDASSISREEWEAARTAGR